MIPSHYGTKDLILSVNLESGLRATPTKFSRYCGRCLDEIGQELQEPVYVRDLPEGCDRNGPHHAARVVANRGRNAIGYGLILAPIASPSVAAHLGQSLDESIPRGDGVLGELLKLAFDKIRFTSFWARNARIALLTPAV